MIIGLHVVCISAANNMNEWSTFYPKPKTPIILSIIILVRGEEEMIPKVDSAYYSGASHRVARI